MTKLRTTLGRNYQNMFTIILVGLVIVLSFAYAYFQAHALIIGPEIAFTSPQNETVVTDPRVTVTGTAERIAFLELNERQIFINEAGVFEEELILSPGMNIIQLEAEDRFGRTVTRHLHVFFDEDPSLR